jgi:hypothetical protein
MRAGATTTRAVNPIAWDKGVVYCQCSKCEVWHALKVNNPMFEFEEVVYNRADNSADEDKEQQKQG